MKLVSHGFHLPKSCQLIIPDERMAETYLLRIGYFRLSAYSLSFQTIKDVFNPGTIFDNILKVYFFDRRLRLLVLDAIERIEVSIRAQIVNFLALKYHNSHWQDDPAPGSPPQSQGLVIGESSPTARKHQICEFSRPNIFWMM